MNAVSEDDWPLRVLATVPLIALGLLWSNHHLGVGGGQPALMAALAAALPVALGVMTQLLDKAQQESLAARLRGLLSRVVTWRLLAVLYLAFGIVAVTWTSVVVLAEDEGRLGRVALQALDDPAARPEIAHSDDKGPARFIVAGRPFGRSFRLELEGYVPQSVEVYPIVGLRVRPSRDLLRSPSVLLRFSELSTGSWSDVGGAELRLAAVDAAGAEKLLATTKQPSGALIIGRGQPVPPGWAANWRVELLAKGVTNETLVARNLVAWKQPRLLATGATLEPGMTLRATLTNAQSRVVARAEFVLGADALQDQAMEDIE